MLVHAIAKTCNDGNYIIKNIKLLQNRHFMVFFAEIKPAFCVVCFSAITLKFFASALGLNLQRCEN